METEQEESPNIEAGAIQEVQQEAPPAKRRIAHFHNSDKRANQRGPVWESINEPMGRQTKEPCFEAVYHIHNPGDFKINEKHYHGRVVVPECVANTLCSMDREWMRVESKLFRNNPVSMHWDR